MRYLSSPGLTWRSRGRRGESELGPVGISAHEVPARRHSAPARAQRGPALGKMLFALDTTRPLRYITPMPPPTPLPVIAHLIGLFRQGFWRRLAGRFFGRKATQQAQDPVEEFLLPILEAISRIAAAVQAGTYREPEYAPDPPDEREPRQPGEPPDPSAWKPPPIRKPEREPAPPWLSGPRPRRPRPPPAPSAAEEPSPHPSDPGRPRGSVHRGRPPAPPPGYRSRRPGSASDQKKPDRSL